jgi:hypothetical protein
MSYLMEYRVLNIGFIIHCDKHLAQANLLVSKSTDSESLARVVELKIPILKAMLVHQLSGQPSCF